MWALPEISAGRHLSFKTRLCALSQAPWVPKAHSSVLFSLLGPLAFPLRCTLKAPRTVAAREVGGTCLGVEVGSNRIFQKCRQA